MGGEPWQCKERSLALSANPGQDGRVYLYCTVPHGRCQGKHTWARMVCWAFHRLPGMTWKQWQTLDEDEQHVWQANHLNRNPHITLPPKKTKAKNTKKKKKKKKKPPKKKKKKKKKK